ncbi:hypothetical protein ACIO93_36530 [Streptomyces sp. NPDC087903]
MPSRSTYDAINRGLDLSAQAITTAPASMRRTPARPLQRDVLCGA